MKHSLIRSFALFIAVVAPSFAQQTPKGSLVIIGGGNRGEHIMSEFIRLAGGSASTVVVFPMASMYADSAEMKEEQTASMKKWGAGTVRYLNLNPKQADTDSALRLLDGVTGVFFAGGDQSKLTAALKGTRVEKRLHELYQNGAVIGGTSAGAAVMSRVMITGDERLNTDSANVFQFIKKGNVVTSHGFGFLDNVIIDQHFIRRKRHNRLISLVLENPNLLGVGIDEATAIVVKSGSIFTVVGEATVAVYDATAVKDVSMNDGGHLAGTGIKFHLLKAGDTFDIVKRTLIPGEGKR